MGALKPLGNKRALLVTVRHVRCKPGSKLSGLSGLDFAHRDALAFRDYLITVRGYQADDVILMMDSREHPKHLWPTRKRILRQIDRLTSNVPEDCRFCFYFSGHGLEEDHGGDRARKRADGRDSEIVCADGKPILHNVLHERLIAPLEGVSGSKLFALFDCCHSETLLNLRRGSGPNTYSRAWAVGAGQLFKDVGIAMVNLLKSRKKDQGEDRDPQPPPRRTSTQWRSPPTSATKEVGMLSVVSLSACRDQQFAHDDREREMTFTQCFLEVVKTKPDITWTELRDSLAELIAQIKATYENACSIREPQSPRYSTTRHMNLTTKASV